MYDVTQTKVDITTIQSYFKLLKSELHKHFNQTMQQYYATLCWINRNICNIYK